MPTRNNLIVFAVVFTALMVAQAYYWESQAIPRPNEDGQPPMDDSRIKEMAAEGRTFIRYFYTNGCAFSKNASETVGTLEAKYPVERINAAKYCWSGKKTADCPPTVPAFVIYRNGEKLVLYGDRSAELIDNVTRNGKAAMVGELDGQ